MYFLMSSFISESRRVGPCDDLFVLKREVIGFSSFICRAPHREIFLGTFFITLRIFSSSGKFACFGGSLPVSLQCAK